MRTKALILASIFLACGAAGAARADEAPALIDGTSPDDVLNLARGYGSATLGKQDNGDPKISGKINGQPYAIYFSSCTANAACKDIDLYAGFADAKPSADSINDWNRSTRFARAYIDKDGSAGMDMDVDLEHGVTSDNLDATLGIWAELVDRFGKFVQAK